MLYCCIASPHNVTCLVLLTPVAVSVYAQQRVINTIFKQILYHEEIGTCMFVRYLHQQGQGTTLGGTLSFVSVEIMNIATTVCPSL